MHNLSPLFAFNVSRNIARLKAWAVLCFEGAWPLIQPFLLVSTLFVAVSFFGVFAHLGTILHFILLVIFFIAALCALIPIKYYKFPTRREIDRRIEATSHLPLSALNVQDDYLPNENSDPIALALWHEHQARMLDKTKVLKTGYPKPDMPRHDPYALRFIVWLFFAVSLFVGFSPSGGYMRDAFDFTPPIDNSLLRIDAWVSPPAYTNEAPIYLTQKDKYQQSTIKVPQGSIVTLRVINGSNVHVSARGQENGEHFSLNEEKDNNNKLYTLKLEKSTQISLSARYFNKAWTFQVEPDQILSIALTAEPGRVLNGSLELKYKIEDDYGAIKAWAEIKPTQEAPKGHALYDAPEVSLQLPDGGKGETKTIQELANHPWAGSEVSLTLYAQDGAGHIAKSETRTIVLPQRVFGNPLARAIAEQRRILVRDTFQRNHVLDMLSALLVRPADTIDNPTHVMALRSIWTRLSYAENDDLFRDSADYMWQVALGIEGSQLDQAKARLKQAQAALRDAIRNGASAEEIARLMKELRSASDEYIAALAQTADEDKMSETPPENIQKLTGDDLAKKLKQLEDLAKTGDRSAAEQLLSELEQMMDNMQVTQGGQGSTAGQQKQNGNQKNLDQLSDLMRRQQNLLDETDRLQKDFERGEKSEKQYENELNELQNKQQEIQSDLGKLQKDFESQGFKPDPSLKDAERQAGEAEKKLENKNSYGAIKDQSQILQSMRKGAENMMKDMKEAEQKNQDNKADEQSYDPLGRSYQDSNEGNIIPNESDIQRARRILDEIRQKLGEALTPEVEKKYLEQLLKFD